MSRRSFMMLAQQYNPEKHTPNGWFISEKWDGIRAFWDGGITRGIFADQIPWANTSKDSRFKERPIATGLWSRYGKVIHAPSWWLDELPPFTLDGELWIAHGKWQQTSSIVSRLNPTADWEMIKYMVFDSPPYQQILRDGRVKEMPAFEKEFNGCEAWALTKCLELERPYTEDIRFELRLNRLKKAYIENDFVKLTPHHMLSRQTEVMHKEIEGFLNDVLERGGEGVMLRHHFSFWTPNRVHELLKYKPYQDAEAEVVGYIWGKETDKGSRLLGKMGAMICKLENDKEFQLSGFSDAEREIEYTPEYLSSYDDDYITDVFELGAKYQGTQISSHLYNPKFPIGSKVTFKYRELSNEGIPKEARYWRKEA